MKLLNGASDWKISVDLRTSLQFLVHIIQTEKQLDIVAWSDLKKSVRLIELTVPWEENWEKAHEQKENRYETLRANCVEKGWICHVNPIEVGCCDFLGHSVISFLSKIGITGRSLRVASNRLQTAAQYASSWIWPYVGVHRSTSLTSSSLLLQQCPACLARLTCIVFVMGGKWPYSWRLVGCCRQDLFNIALNILV